eukprot:1136304-Pelagomonas_calceolata.AAC.1
MQPKKDMSSWQSSKERERRVPRVVMTCMGGMSNPYSSSVSSLGSRPSSPTSTFSTTSGKIHPSFKLLRCRRRLCADQGALSRSLVCCDNNNKDPTGLKDLAKNAVKDGTPPNSDSPKSLSSTSNEVKDERLAQHLRTAFKLKGWVLESPQIPKA